MGDNNNYSKALKISAWMISTHTAGGRAYTVWSYDNRETQYTKFVCGGVQIPSATGNTNARQLGEISAASATTWYPTMSRIIADPIIAGTEYNIAGIDYVGILYAYPTGGNGNNSMKDIVLS